jgi:hypothetical protein
MYGIGATTDLSFLKGKTLCQVAFGPYDLQLGFEQGFSGGARISIQSSVGYGESDGSYLPRIIGKPEEGETTVLQEPGFLLALLMKEVADVSWTSDGTLSLSFSGDIRLQIYDDYKAYESYQVSNGDDLIVV